MNTAPQARTPWRIAHRGYHARCVENTLEAFTAAYGLGCDGVEFDVQLCADGTPVVFHDDDLLRLAGRPEAVYELTARELRVLPLRDSLTSAVGRIPTLEEFLRKFGSMLFYLEIKIPPAKTRDPAYWRALTEKAVAALSGSGRHPHSFVASFHLDAVRYALGGLNSPRAVAIHENAAGYRAALAAPPSDLLARRLYDSIPFSVFRAARPRSFRPERILLWDVSGADQFRSALDSGVAGVVAEDVPLMLKME